MLQTTFGRRSHSAFKGFNILQHTLQLTEMHCNTQGEEEAEMPKTTFSCRSRSAFKGDSRQIDWSLQDNERSEQENR